MHFAAVAVPAEFDQDRGTDSSPFPESLGAAVAHVARAASAGAAEREQEALLLFSPTPSLLWILTLSILSFISG